MRNLRAAVAVMAAAVSISGCGGGDDVGRAIGQAISHDAQTVADRVVATRGTSMSARTAQRTVARSGRQQLVLRAQELAEWVGTTRERVEPVCTHIARAKFRVSAPDEQLYTIMSEGAKAVTPFAAFVEVGVAFGHFSHGDIEELWDAWCI